MTTRYYEPEEITKMMFELRSEGWEFDVWDGAKITGWFINRNDPRFSYRPGDPKPFNIAVINAYERRAYVLSK